MLIWLDDSVASACGSQCNFVCSGLSSIFQAFQRGEHLIHGSRLLFDTLAQSQQLAAWERRVAATLWQQSTQIGKLANNFTFRVIIVNTNGPLFEKTSQTEWRIQLKEIGSKGIRAPVLLAEDITDTRLFELAAWHYIFNQGYGSALSIKLDPRMAGGKGNVFRQFRSLLESAREWCLCLTDSDKMSPTGKPIGTSSRHLKKLPAAFSTSAISEYAELPVREVENLIPFNLIEQSLRERDNDSFQRWIKLIEENQSPDNIVNFADLKLGTAFSNIKSQPENSPNFIFWKQEIDRLINLGIGIHSEECAHKSESQDKIQNCNCMITNAISTHLVELVIDYLDNIGKQQSYQMIKKSRNIDGWLKIGRIVAEWSCASGLKRI